jgi:dTDP-4-amino-4,6-dideoxygalactose transaminase
MNKLALFGGKPVRSEDVALDESWPDTRKEDLDAVNRVFESQKFIGIHNEEVERLEQDYADYVGTKYAVALGSGTAALHAAVSAVGIGPGDEVIVPALTFLASATSVLHNVGIPVFADIDPITYNIDPASIEEKISSRTKAIMVVDLHGLPADYEAIRALAKKHNLAIIEDAAHATGASYFGKKAGSLGDVAGTSIMPGKQLPACGEGGLFSTDDETAYNRAGLIRMFGEVIRKDKPRSYNAYTLGWNYRLNPVQAAFARSQLERLDDYSELFMKNGKFLSDGMKELPGLIPPYVPEGSTHVYHMFRFKLDPNAAGLDISAGRFTKAVEDAMTAEGLPFRYYQSIPVPGQAVFQLREGFGDGVPWTLPGARDISYDIEEFPTTLEVIETTRCIGRGGSSGPNYFRSKQAMEFYLEGFHKVWENLSELASYATGMDYQPPWGDIGAPSTRGDWTVLTPSLQG